MAEPKSYFDALNMAEILADHPIGQPFLDTFTGMSRDALRARQEKLFARLLKRAWEIPFYRRHWGAVGLEPGDIKGLDDLPKIPMFSKSDIMDSIAQFPPFGDFHGIETLGPDRPPVVFHTTSGTTGRPQVLLFGPKSREIQNLMLGRLYRLQGIGAGDVVHSVYGHGMINGGHFVRETFLHWTNAIFMSAGTGIETRSIQQVELMRDFGATVLVGFADYLKKLSQVATENGIIPGEHIKIRKIVGHLGRENREAISAAWGGAECYDWYGVGDTGMIAGELADRDGMTVMEDGQFVEICDIDTGAPVADGKSGDMVVTVLFKDDVYPIIRFNTHDVSAFKTTPSSMKLPFRRLEGFLGRSDNMVKLRGINIFPQGIGAMMEELSDFAGDYICEATRDANGRDDMTVHVELLAAEAAYGERLEPYKALLKRKIGIEVNVAFAAKGALAHLTQTEIRQKPIRLIDKRFGDKK